jgi:formylmethanofuran dehydrogenase subunit E
MATFSTVPLVKCALCFEIVAKSLVQGHSGQYICLSCLRKNHIGGF